MKNKSKDLGIQIPSILFPDQRADLSKWSVVACDQYTSQPEYWGKASDLVSGSPSTLHLILPEVYLENEGKEKRIQKINETMQIYLDEHILIEQKPGFIYIDRQTPHAKSRKGLILAVDLEKYDYNKGSRSLIRATEGTVIDRLPPRIKIRENASVELPHIMLLIDDPEKTVIEPLENRTASMEKLYDFDLMMNGGHIKGYKIDGTQIISDIVDALAKLADPDVFRQKYNVGTDKDILLFAVGDGNHSLASAKGHWENVKKTLSKDRIEDHPARFALVEVVNVHDNGLKFEPIHRVVFKVNTKQLLDDMMKHCNGSGAEAYYQIFDTMQSAVTETKNLNRNKATHIIPFVANEFFGIVVVKKPVFNLEVGTLQGFLDKYISVNVNARVDYIHGTDVVNKLGSKKGNIGFLLPATDKNDLFKTVILDGALPRKTFSMGEAEEKRFYLECRKIV